MRTWKNYGIYLALLCGAVLTSCNDDDDDDDGPDTPDPVTYASVTANDQHISQNILIVSAANVPEDGWIVIHRDNGGAPQVPEIISNPVYIQDGTNANIEVHFDDVELTDGETVWVMLHEDTDDNQQYGFDGSGNGVDAPFKDADGNIVMTSTIIRSPEVQISDQPVINNTITVDHVEMATDGWLVVHNETGAIIGNGPDLTGIIGKVQLSAGTHENVEVQLDDLTYTSGQKLYPMLHIDNGQEGVYEFDIDDENTNDPAEVFGNEAFPGNVIFTEMEVQE